MPKLLRKYLPILLIVDQCFFVLLLKRVLTHLESN